MAPIDWSTRFDEGKPKPGCSVEEIRKLSASIARPLDDEELAYLREIVARNSTEPDPILWPWPRRGLPESYLSFLRWSNGGTFRCGERWVEFFEAGWARNTMLANLFPLIVPRVVPFAAPPTSGGWYGFDTGVEPVDGEFPVLRIAAGGQMRIPTVVSHSFPEFCGGGW